MDAKRERHVASVLEAANAAVVWYWMRSGYSAAENSLSLIGWPPREEQGVQFDGFVARRREWRPLTLTFHRVRYLRLTMSFGAEVTFAQGGWEDTADYRPPVQDRPDALVVTLDAKGGRYCVVCEDLTMEPAEA